MADFKIMGTDDSKVANSFRRKAVPQEWDSFFKNETLHNAERKFDDVISCG
jgi:hypothetical protein